MPETPRFVRQDFVRCLDCDIRGDLHADGRPQAQARGHIHDCLECHGKGHVSAPSHRDPYDGVDGADRYVRRRQARAGKAVIGAVPRTVRRRYLEAVRIETLMSEEPTHAG